MENYNYVTVESRGIQLRLTAEGFTLLLQRMYSRQC